MELMELEFTEQEQEARQEFESAREEIKNKNQEEYNVLRFTLEGLIEELERHFDSAHTNYMATTEQRTQANRAPPPSASTLYAFLCLPCLPFSSPSSLLPSHPATQALHLLTSPSSIALLSPCLPAPFLHADSVFVRTLRR